MEANIPMFERTSVITEGVKPMSKLVTRLPPMERAALQMMNTSLPSRLFFFASRAMQRKKRSGTEICHSTHWMAGERKPKVSSQRGNKPGKEERNDITKR